MELALISTTFAIMAEVQWVASAGGSVWVSITTRSVMFDPSGGMRDGRVLSRRRPS
jgi:hypothetical protein